MRSDVSCARRHISDSDHPGAEAAADRAQALYVFCLARRSALAALDGAGLQSDQPLDLVSVGQVAAVVSAVNVDDFCGPMAEARMSDLAWTGPRVCRHEEVIERVMRTSPVVPARFATLFSSRASVVAWLERHHAQIVRTLSRFAQQQEWAVKVTLDRRKAEDSLIAAAPERSAGAVSPGAGYLAERRLRAGLTPALTSWLAELCGRIARQLLLHAVAFRERAAGPTVAGEEGEPILNWAFLVRCERRDEFFACISLISATHREQGVVLECSGPWPAYSFCPPIDRDSLENYEISSD